MTNTTIKIGFIIALAIASVATPLAIQRHAQVKLHDADLALRTQADRFAQLTAENERLSNLLIQAKAKLSDEQLRELLRLRNEVGQLRTQTNVIHNLREENAQLGSRLTSAQEPPMQMSPAERDEKLSAETIEAMKNISRELRPAMQRFANDHTNQAPTDFSELRNYFPISGGNRMTGLYTFGFVRDNGPMPGDALILSENGTHRKPDGKWARVYAFSDGRVVEQTSDENNFDAWEKEHMILPPSPNP
jgi:hypothetical protein